jgi:hypothetical protein
MWIFLNDAFISIVQHPEIKNMLVVRARLKGDLEALFPKAKIEETPMRDYRFRTFLKKVVVGQMLFDRTLSLDYGNFKGSVPYGPRHDAYLRVWGVMYGAQNSAQQAERMGRIWGENEFIDLQPVLPFEDYFESELPRRGRKNARMEGPIRRR